MGPLTFGTLALIVAVGLAGPLLALLPSRVAPPIVIGEIAAGVAIGHTGTRTIDPNQPTLAFLADIGFALLMFIVGTHLPMRDRRLVPALRRALLPTAVVVAAGVALAPVVAELGGLHRATLIWVLLVSSSAAVVLPIVQSDVGKVGLVSVVWVSFLDVLTVLAVPLVLATGGVGRALVGSILVIAGAALIAVSAPRLAALPAIETLRHASHHRDWALDLRMSLLVLFTLAWVAERFDTSVLIAGFAVGVAVTAIGEPRRVADQLIGLGEGFFVPLFFVVLGARLDLRALFRSGSDLRLLVLLVAGATVVHVVGAVVTRLPVGHGLLATAQLGVPSAVAAIGLANHTIRPGQGAAIIGAAAASLAIAAVGAALCGIRTAPTPPHP